MRVTLEYIDEKNPEDCRTVERECSSKEEAIELGRYHLAKEIYAQDYLNDADHFLHIFNDENPGCTDINENEGVYTIEGCEDAGFESQEFKTKEEAEEAARKHNLSHLVTANSFKKKEKFKPFPIEFLHLLFDGHRVNRNNDDLEIHVIPGDGMGWDCNVYVSCKIQGRKRKPRSSAEKRTKFPRSVENKCECGWQQFDRTGGTIISILAWCKTCKKRMFTLCNRDGTHSCVECEELL